MIPVRAARVILCKYKSWVNRIKLTKMKHILQSDLLPNETLDIT